jgi:hypothetical protein
MIKTILKFEGFTIFLACLYFYHRLDASWLLFFLFWLLPDISMIGYLRDKQMGAFVYNLAHNYILGLLIIFLGLLQNNNIVVSLGIILVSHIGLDRFLGYGLKYTSGFKDTHIQKL